MKAYANAVYQIKEVEKITPGSLLDEVKKPVGPNLENQGKPWTEAEKLHNIVVAD